MVKDESKNQRKPAGGGVKHAGQPTKYKSTFCKAIIAFFDIDPWEEREIEHFKDGKVVWTDIKVLPVRMPSLIKFAKSIKVAIRTVYGWVDKEHDSFQEEFLHAYTHAKQIRREWLIDVGLCGSAPPASFKFVAVNCTDMRDKTEAEITGKDGGPLQVNVTVTKTYKKEKNGNG